MNIDFVILWVDGNDPAWLSEKQKYQGSVENESNSVNRYRDWGLLPYWFRAVEQFSPWVHKIFFVTWGHIPSFLNQHAKNCRLSAMMNSSLRNTCRPSVLMPSK